LFKEVPEQDVSEHYFQQQQYSNRHQEKSMEIGGIQVDEEVEDEEGENDEEEEESEQESQKEKLINLEDYIAGGDTIPRSLENLIVNGKGRRRVSATVTDQRAALLHC
jgi:hypothetical protein